MDISSIRTYKAVFDVLGYTTTGALAVVAAWKKWRSAKGHDNEGDIHARVIRCEKSLNDVRSTLMNHQQVQLEMHRDNLEQIKLLRDLVLSIKEKV